VRRAVLLAALAASACGGDGDSAGAATAVYVDSRTCAECHDQEARLWSGSHHDLAMQEATEETVLGDFDDASFEHFGVTTRFFRRDGGFFVNTEGPDGALADFEIEYTFGVEPLQQYLIELPGGRVQCLTIAWDTERREWFHLYPDERIEPGDELHWTGRYQRWNAMCAECHSTDLKKNYDPATDTYATTWHEIDVGCQACHGPGSVHLAQAETYQRDGRWADDAKGLTAVLRRGDPVAQIDVCAPCHSRRTKVRADVVPGEPFLETYIPERLHAGLYHADGQILDEVYVWGSFAQSKMHMKGVACTDCHDAHSLRLFEPGPAVCLQCHTSQAPLDRFPSLKEKDYATPEHHHHPEDSEGASCVACHMIERTYMGVDTRRDHSFRIPRPDLTVALGTPNACNDCHSDETPEWAAAHVSEWRGGAEPPPHYATVFAAARAGDPDALPGLADLVLDVQQPPIVRSTAIEMLRPFGPNAIAPVQAVLADGNILVRASAARGLEAIEQPAQRLAAIQMLEDPALPVRLEIAMVLAAAPIDQLGPEWGAIFARAAADFRAAQAVNLDLPSTHLNLALFADARGDREEAAREYEVALAHDPAFLPARFNMATLLNRLGRNKAAELVLRRGIELAPDEGELYYSLGLLLAEMNRQDEAAAALMSAATRLPDRPRVHYNAGLALLGIERLAEAEAYLTTALELEPRDPDVHHALVLLYVKLGDRERALEHARRLRELVPEAPPPEELVEGIVQDLESQASQGGGG